MQAEGPTQAQVADTFELIIRWRPSSGAVQVQFPNIDHVSMFGMLEMAKQVLTEARISQGAAKQLKPGLIVPPAGVKLS